MPSCDTLMTAAWSVGGVGAALGVGTIATDKLGLMDLSMPTKNTLYSSSILMVITAMGLSAAVLFEACDKGNQQVRTDVKSTKAKTDAPASVGKM